MVPVASAIAIDSQLLVSPTNLLLAPTIQLSDAGFITPVHGLWIGNPLSFGLQLVEGQVRTGGTRYAHLEVFT